MSALLVCGIMVIFSIWRLQCFEAPKHCHSFIIVFTQFFGCIHKWKKNGRYISVVSWRECYASTRLARWYRTWHESRVNIEKFLFPESAVSLFHLFIFPFLIPVWDLCSFLNTFWMLFYIAWNFLFEQIFLIVIIVISKVYFAFVNSCYYPFVFCLSYCIKLETLI